MTYLVLIADIVDSRRLADRGQVQNRLMDALGRINRRGSPIESPYTVTLGDEFQAVFSGATGMVEDLASIQHALHPARVRFSYGVGDITTAINPRQALQMDGPAFYGARDGLDRLKDSGDLAAITGVAGPVGELLDSSLRAMTNGMTRWRANRFAILRDLMRGDDVKSIAARLDISEVAVYKNIDAGDLRTLMHLARSIEACLDQQLTPERP